MSHVKGVIVPALMDATPVMATPATPACGIVSCRRNRSLNLVRGAYWIAGVVRG